MRGALPARVISSPQRHIAYRMRTACVLETHASLIRRTPHASLSFWTRRRTDGAGRSSAGAGLPNSFLAWPGNVLGRLRQTPSLPKPVLAENSYLLGRLRQTQSLPKPPRGRGP